MYTITGIVVQGAGRGKTLGFPTINIKSEQEIGVEYGVYVGRACVHDVWYNAAISWGVALMFNESQPALEAHLFNFSHTVSFGEKISVELYNKIRDFKKFDTELALIEAIQKDVIQVESFFKNHAENN